VTKAKPRVFILSHDPCSGRLHNGWTEASGRKGEPCNKKTHPGGMVHLRPMSLSWRQGLARGRAAELFSVDLKPGEKAFVEIKCVQKMRFRGYERRR